MMHPHHLLEGDVPDVCVRACVRDESRRGGASAVGRKRACKGEDHLPEGNVPDVPGAVGSDSGPPVVDVCSLEHHVPAMK